MPSKKSNTGKKQNKYRLELRFTSMIFWSLGLLFLLGWSFVLGILVGRGDLSIGIVKNKWAEIHGNTESEVSRNQVADRPSNPDPKFAFYEELSSKKEAAAKEGRGAAGKSSPPTQQKKPAPNRTKTKPLEKKSDSDGSREDTGTQYVLQIGSFQDKATAAALVDRLRGRGYSTFFSRATIKGKRYYRVRCGPFGSENEADYLKKVLAGKEHIQGFVTRAGG